MLKVRWATHNFQGLTVSVRRSTLNVERSTYNVQRTTFNAQRSTFKFHVRATGWVAVQVRMAVTCLLIPKRWQEHIH